MSQYFLKVVVLLHVYVGLTVQNDRAVHFTLHYLVADPRTDRDCALSVTYSHALYCINLGNFPGYISYTSSFAYIFSKAAI
jgi:hypothetical protein